jgi:hypothetical protein
MPPGLLTCTTRLTFFPFHPAQREQCHFSVLENLELGSGVAFSRSKAARTASISPPNRIEHEKPSVRSLGDEVLERDVVSHC